MCGRIFCLFENAETLQEAVRCACQSVDVDCLDVKMDQYFNYKGPNYNVCPTQRVPVLNADAEITLLPWGFHIGSLFVINARSDEIYEKKTFKDIIDHERCVVISSGYYEWQESKTASKKTAYSFTPKDHEVCFIAALRHPASGAVVLVTRPATARLAKIHSRMPVILRPDSLKEWLDPAVALKAIAGDIIDEADYDGDSKDHSASLTIEAVALAPYVNSVKNTGPECLQTLKDYKEQSFKSGIGRYFAKKRKETE